jgi:DNA-binding response OmpR family regulator
MRILVVEDADMVRGMLRDALSVTGGEVDAAPDVETAKQHLRTRAYEWVILDHYLPDGDGLQLLRWIRKKGMAPQAIFVTIEGANPGYREEAGALGAVSVFGKPFSVFTLIATIQAHTAAGIHAVDRPSRRRN